MSRILVVEQERTDESSVFEALSSATPHACARVSWDEVVPEAVSTRETDLLVPVATKQTPQVARLFEWLHKRPSRAQVLAVLPEGADAEVVRATAGVADDFLIAPVRRGELVLRTERALEHPSVTLDAVRQKLLEDLGDVRLIGQDPAFLSAVRMVPRLARSDATVLVTGETGTGKELCARAIHSQSDRRRHPFVAIDCGAVPDQLFENELFGHTRGAFTDANRDQRGLVSMAEGGTLFLDEVDSLSTAAQCKLLRFLQERTFRALGADRFTQANVRVIAATNGDLERRVRDRSFRADLFFRINVLALNLPPLRVRLSDVELLAHAALRDCATRSALEPRSFSVAAMHALSNYHWPGNVRELFSVVQRAAVCCDGSRILPEHLSIPRESEASQPADERTFRTQRSAAVAAFERRFVETLLRKHGGNMTHAAREAQQDRRAFGRIAKKHGVDRRTLAG